MDNEQFEDDFVVASGSPDFRSELAAQLADLAPEVIADGKVDVAKLQELLGEDVADSAERFGLFWPGKKNALRVAQAPTTATLRPDIENSKDWDTTQNVFIEGDNLEVLKILQKHYHNKIKMIYIDPPYNTGKDFVYPDNFKEGLDSYLEWTRQVNEEGKKLSTNSETEGRYHSNWPNMMYPRLKLARNLLTDDGAIFLSIDDNEVENLKRLCNEIFGEVNFIAQLPWLNRVSPANDATWFSRDHEYILVYARNGDRWSPNRLERTDKQNSYYTNPDNDPRGPWNSAAYTCNKSSDERPNLYYPLVNPFTGEEVWPKKTAVWAYSKETHEQNVANNLLYWGVDGRSNSPRKKKFLTEAGRVVPRSYLLHGEVGSTQSSTLEFLKIFEHNYFQYTKPVPLIRRLIEHGTSDGDIVLDFFSGSGTTAHAVMKLNADSGETRTHIQVQLPEPVDPNSQAARDGYRNIADISRERIRRAGAAIVAERDGQLDAGEKPLDVGFRSYKLNASNFAKWNVTSDIEPGKLGEHLMTLRGSADDDATPDDLLTEVLLKQGYSLTEQISKVSIDGLELHSVGDGLVLAYLDEHVKPTLEQFRAVVDAAPARLIVLEDAYQGDDQLKTNLEQLCRSKSIELWRA